jgi:hypothetical protein
MDYCILLHGFTTVTCQDVWVNKHTSHGVMTMQIQWFACG